MAKGQPREPKVFSDPDAAKSAAAECKERAFTLTRGRNEWHVVAPTANVAISDLARHQDTKIVALTPPKGRDKTKVLKSRVSKMTEEEKAQLRALLDGPAPTPAV